MVSSVDRVEGSEDRAIPALISHSFRAHGAPQRNQDLQEQGLGRWVMLRYYFTVLFHFLKKDVYFYPKSKLFM